MSFLLDTNVVSELRKPAARAAPAVRAWARRQRTGELSISVISVLEVEIGVGRMELRDPAQGRVLRAWLERDLLTAFQMRILPVDLLAVRAAALMHVPPPRSDRDVLIAATAQSRGLVVVTPNTADFEPLGVERINPWEE